MRARSIGLTCIAEGMLILPRGENAIALTLWTGNLQVKDRSAYASLSSVRRNAPKGSSFPVLLPANRSARTPVVLLARLQVHLEQVSTA